MSRLKEDTLESHRTRSISAFDSVSFNSQNQYNNQIRVKKNSIFVCQKIVQENSHIAHEIYSSHKTNRKKSLIKVDNSHKFGETSRKLIFDMDTEPKDIKVRNRLIIVFVLKIMIFFTLLYVIYILYELYLIDYVSLGGNETLILESRDVSEASAEVEKFIKEHNLSLQEEMEEEITTLESIKAPDELKDIVVSDKIEKIESKQIGDEKSELTCNILENISAETIASTRTFEPQEVNSETIKVSAEDHEYIYATSFQLLLLVLSYFVYSVLISKETRISEVIQETETEDISPSAKESNKNSKPVNMQTPVPCKKAKISEITPDTIDSGLGSFRCLELTSTDVNLTPVRRSHRLRNHNR